MSFADSLDDYTPEKQEELKRKQQEEETIKDFTTAIKSSTIAATKLGYHNLSGYYGIIMNTYTDWAAGDSGPFIVSKCWFDELKIRYDIKSVDYKVKKFYTDKQGVNHLCDIMRSVIIQLGFSNFEVYPKEKTYMHKTKTFWETETEICHDSYTIYVNISW